MKAVLLRPHYKASAYPYITDKLLQQVANTNNTKLYALDDDSALQIIGDAIKVAGEGQWKLFTPR